MMQPGSGMAPPPPQQQQYQQPPPQMAPQHQYQQPPSQWPPMMQPPPQQPMPPQQQFQQPLPPQPQYYQGLPPPAAAPQIWGQQMPPAAPPPQQQPIAPMQYQQSDLAAVQAAAPAAAGEVRSLWIGDLQYWMDENYLYNCFMQSGEVVSVKIIRNKQHGHSEGYGFVEFASRAAAEQVLHSLNGQPMPGVDNVFRLNWAGEKRGDDGADYTIFVGDLAADVTDYILQETFRLRYPSVKGAKVVLDRLTGRSKGYGFVRFDDLNEQNRAMTEMNGVYCSSRPMRIGLAAANKKNMGGFQQQLSTNTYQTQATQGDFENDPNNTTIFVGGLDPNVNEEVLRQTFSPFGEIGYVKIPVGKRCGFVQFANRASAEEAIRLLNGTQLGGQNVRLSWGRTPQNRQVQQPSQQFNGNFYGYSQNYDANYGYTAPSAQDPNAYNYGAYQGYGNYQQQPQQQQ